MGFDLSSSFVGTEVGASSSSSSSAADGFPLWSMSFTWEIRSCRRASETKVHRCGAKWTAALLLLKSMALLPLTTALLQPESVGPKKIDDDGIANEDLTRLNGTGRF